MDGQPKRSEYGLDVADCEVARALNVTTKVPRLALPYKVKRSVGENDGGETRQEIGDGRQEKWGRDWWVQFEVAGSLKVWDRRPWQ